MLYKQVVTLKVGKSEFYAYFYRTEINDSEEQGPFKPLALLNYPMIDEKFGRIAMDFWNLIWNNDKCTIHGCYFL